MRGKGKPFLRFFIITGNMRFIEVVLAEEDGIRQDNQVLGIQSHTSIPHLSNIVQIE